ncbi:MAG: carboxypeptidase-like regulatory domain-containing protein [Prevotella sp.]|nr:carboxypeptidase-like regulatory domain-containing protein [Prevotella sp.]
MKRYLILAIIQLLIVLYAEAQITGQILDASDGQPIPYASALYKSNKIAVPSNAEGKFQIERHNGWKLTVSSVGYVSQVITINSSTPNHLVIKLKPDNKKLQEVVIKTKRKSRYSRKNNPAVELMRKVIAAKKKTDLRRHDYYQFNNYQKITVALNDLKPEDMEKEKSMFKKHPWLLNQVEMCQYNEKLTLPVSVEEKVTQKLYRKDPHTEKTIIRGENSTGVNDYFQTGDILNAVLKDVFTDIDIYEDNIRLFQYPFTSPIGRDAIAFYRFYITDTLNVGGDRCIQLDFTPNNQIDMGFRGQIYILDDSTYQVKRCDLTIPKTSEVNWVDNMQCQQEFVRLETGEWVLAVDDMFCELQITKSFGKAIVIRTNRRSDFSFDEIPKHLLRGKRTELKDAYAEMRGDDFWNQYRQVELTQSETTMGQFVKNLANIKGFKYVVFGIKSLIENFVETSENSKVDIGPVNTIVSQNFYDKVRFRASAQTTANLHKHLFLKGYYAYGVEHHQNYYGTDVTWTLNTPGYLPREFPRQAFTFSTTRDVAMPSDKFIRTDKDNMFTSFKWSKIDKMFLYNRQQLSFDYEQEYGTYWYANFKTEEVAPIGNIALERLSDNHQFASIRYTEATVGFRYAPGESFINTKQHRWPLNLDAPVFRIQHTMGIKGFLGGEYKYNFTEGEIYKRLWLPMNWGKFDARIKFGAQWNRVPYPLLIMPVANLSYILEDETFNLINNMEFLNDRYASAEIRWDLNGKIFNRLPLIRRLKWREFIGLKCLWGTLTDKNNPYLAENQGSEILMAFPDGCYIMDGKHPYWELSLGIHNILKLFHVEYVRRLNYLDLPTANKQGVRFTFRASF